jgi:preprotein translocase subunit SecF
MMRTLHLITVSFFLVFAIQSIAVAQSVNLTETFKKSFNETVQEVHKTADATEKRALLNESFSKMTVAIERIESKANLSEEEIAQLKTYKSEIQEKKSELNGTDGFDKVLDKDLNDFSDYSQQYFEQADRTITIGLTAALLIVLILILL